MSVHLTNLSRLYISLALKALVKYCRCHSSGSANNGFISTGFAIEEYFTYHLKRLAQCYQFNISVVPYKLLN
jgi:hypothetical protein